MRRAANPTRKISITIPGNLFNELERTLSYSQSRSRFISAAIDEKLSAASAPSITESSTRQLMAALMNRDDVDETMRQLLLQILSK
jgi:metal-responsive CopG/Arc/MetJ family transcriptional regulator